MKPSRLFTIAAVAAVALQSCGGAPSTPDPAPGEQATGALPTVPQQAGAPSTPARSALVRLPNGMSAFVQSAARGSAAQLQFGVLAGSLFVAPGLAELAAETLLRSTDPTTGTKSLRQRITSMGGSVEAHVGLMTTWIDIRVRVGVVDDALTALRESLETVTRSRTQIERTRDALVELRTAEIVEDPVTAAARALLQAERSTADYLDALLDRDPSEVTLFHSRLYRPERCVLTIRAPMPVQEALGALRRGERPISAWTPPPALPGKSPVLERKFTSGLYWTQVETSGGDARCAIVMQLPDVVSPAAAEWLVMHSCLTLGGTGGRLERLQDEAGLSRLQWDARIERTPDTLALVMTTVAAPAEVAQLWRIYQRARQSLLDVPPSASELQLALRRAQLNAGLPTQHAGDHLRLDTNLKLRGRRPEAIMTQLAAMADPATWDVRRAAQAFVQTPAWMVAVGPNRPDGVEGLVATEMLPGGFDPASRSEATPENLAAVDPWLSRARGATGGEVVYRDLAGFEASARVLSADALVAEDALSWSLQGALARKRSVLGQEVSTSVAKDAAYEEFGEVRKSLTPREASLLRHEMMRHPVMLLAAHQRGAMRFRPIAVRQVEDRELYVLEAVGDEFDRLRLYLDTESLLIRVVESWERLADDTLTHIREEWSDYRDVGGLRVPHRRRTSWNDGQRQTETVYSAWRAK